MVASPSSSEPTPASARPFAPLAGKRVVEWCGYAAGPFTGKALAALGADVIKVEPPLGGDESRQLGPFPGDIPDPEQSGLYLYLNNGKRSITLDPTTGDGRALLLRLITEWADVFIEDRPPALMEQLGLTYEALAAAKPGLVMTSITSFGQSGPYRDFKLYPTQTAHAGGAAYILPDGFHYEDYGDDLPPREWPRLVSDYSSGVLGASGTLAALLSKQFTGRGQHVDISKQQAQMHPMRYAIDAYPNEGIIRKRQNAPRPPGTIDRSSISGTYDCKDGYVALWPIRPGMPESLVEWLGPPEWAKSERWTDENQRGAHSKEFRGLIQAEFMNYTRDELFHGLQAANVCISPLYKADEVMASNQFAARDFFKTVHDPLLGDLPYPGLPFKVSGTADPQPGAAPRLGEHNREVFTGILGLQPAMLAELRRGGAI